MWTDVVAISFVFFGIFRNAYYKNTIFLQNDKQKSLLTTKVTVFGLDIVLQIVVITYKIKYIVFFIDQMQIELMLSRSVFVDRTIIKNNLQ